MILTFFDEIVLRRKLSYVFLLSILLRLIFFKTLNLLWQCTFHINPTILFIQLLLVDNFSDMLINIFEFTLTDCINPRMINNLITGISISSAWVVSVIVADIGLIVVDGNILIGMLYLPFVTNAVWSWSIDGILKVYIASGFVSMGYQSWLKIQIRASCCLSINRSRQRSIGEIVYKSPARLLFGILLIF